jgi:hypothetical protein
MLRERAVDLHAVVPEHETIREASMARIEAENALKRLVSHPQEFGRGLKPDDPLVVAAERVLAKATDDFERIKQRSETRSAAWQAASGALANVETWLKSGRPGNTTLEAVEVEVPKLGKNETSLLDAISNRRRRVRELRADLHRIESAPFPSSHAKAQMRAQIEALAMQGAPDVTNLIEHDGKIIWPTRRVQVDIFNAQPGAVGFVELPDMLALDAWRHKSDLIAALDAEINTEADDPASLSHADRELRTAEAMADLLEIERQEAALIWTAQAQGLPCEFRHDMNQLAILQLRLVTVVPTNGQASSPEREGFNLIGRGQ